MARVKAVYNKLVAEIKGTAKQVVNGIKDLMTRITTDDKD